MRMRPTDPNSGDVIPQRLPLLIDPENRDNTSSKDARLVNAYVERVEGASGTPSVQVSDYNVFKRPGLLDSGTGQSASSGAGVYNWKNDVYSIFGTTFYKNGVSKGTVDGTGGVYRFSSCLGTTPKLQFGNGVKAYNYDDSNGLVLINDPDFPSAFVKGWAFLDGTTYVMDAKANIQGSNINDPTAWDPLNTLQAQIEPDGGVALAKHLVNALALKQWTTEVFYDAGNSTGSPLGRVAGAKMNYGCASQDSVQDLDGDLVWLATSRSSALCVVMVSQLKLQVVSTKSIDRLLRGLDLTTIFSWSFKTDGHRFYGITSKVSNLTLVFDLTERRWHQWTDSNGNYFPVVASTYDSSMRHILQHETNGKLYYCDPSYFNDDGAVITTDIYTPSWDGGARRRKFLPLVDFVSDQQAGSYLQVRHSDDDYRSWSTFRRVDLSLKRPMLRNNGSFKQRAYHFRHPANTAFRIRAVDLHVMPGEN